jgi:hypothetical protein
MIESGGQNGREEIAAAGVNSSHASSPDAEIDAPGAQC